MIATLSVRWFVADFPDMHVGTKKDSRCLLVTDRIGRRLSLPPSFLPSCMAISEKDWTGSATGGRGQPTDRPKPNTGYAIQRARAILGGLHERSYSQLAVACKSQGSASLGKRAAADPEANSVACKSASR